MPKRLLFTVCFMTACFAGMYAYDFLIKNDQGIPLCYNKLSDTEVAVTFLNENIYYNEGYVSGDLIIPSSVVVDAHIYYVTQISSSAFNRCNKLSSVVIPNTVTYIGYATFSECSSLSSVSIPSSVSVIENRAFYNCTSLKSLVFEDGSDPLTFNFDPYYSGTFLGDESPIEYLYVGRNMKYNYSYPYIDKSPFHDKQHLQTLVIGDNVTEAVNALVSCCQNLKEVKIGQSFSKISKSMFSNTLSLKNVVLPNSVTEIEDMAFWSSGVEEIVMSSNLRIINKHALSHSKLRKLHIPASVDSILAGSLFALDSLRVITIDDSTRPLHITYNNSSGEMCYSQKLEDAYVGRNVVPDKQFGQYFLRGSGVKNVTFGSNVNEVYPNSFHYINSAPVTQITCLGRIKKIHNNALRDCYNLKSIDFLQGIDSIGDCSFWGCKALSSINLPLGLEFIGDFSFNCSALTEILIPSSVCHLGVAIFRDCINLNSATIKCQLTEIPENIFRGCISLQEVFIDQSKLEIINESAFTGCSLQFFIVGDNVTEIKPYAFFANQQLRSLTIGKNITSLSGRSFDGISGLESLTIRAINPPSCNTFSDVNKKTCVLHVPLGYEDSYKNHFFWKKFYNIVGDVSIEDLYVSSIENDGDSAVMPIFNLSGVMVGTTDKLSDLSPGIYICNGHKFIYPAN